MTLQDIDCFLSVAETMSFTQAAQKLCISQPAVTKHINALEKEYQVSLMDRSNKRSLKLTEAGDILFEALKVGKAALNDAESRIKALSEAAPVVTCLPKGILLPYEYVKTFNDFAIEILPAFLQVDYIDKKEYASKLERGDLLICEAEAVPANVELYTQRLTEKKVAHSIIVSRDHPAMINNPDPKPEDFRDCPVFFSQTMPKSLIKKYIRYLQNLYRHTPDHIVYVDNPENVSLMLTANRGITMNTLWMNICSSSKMRTVETSMLTDYYICWNPDKTVNKYIDKLLKTFSIK